MVGLDVPSAQLVMAAEKKSASSKKKGEKGKEKDSKKKESRKKGSADPAPAAEQPATAVPAPAPAPVPADPDAIHLFRRYDRSRSGMLTRADFLQLLRDYADASALAHARRGDEAPGPGGNRWPLSLTDFPGTPMGYERSDRNSEFEAGQLFERYEKKRTGTLTMDDFQLFFADFKTQLRAFVEDAAYFVPMTIKAKPEGVASIKLDGAAKEDQERSKQAAPSDKVGNERPEHVAPDHDEDSAEADSTAEHEMLLSKFQSALWKLRKVCKDDLVAQRERLLQQMKSLRDEVAERQRSNQRSVHGSPRELSFLRTTRVNDRLSDVDENEVAELYEAMEEDYEAIEETLQLVRRLLRQDGRLSEKEMRRFVEQAPSILQRARLLAMKHYEIESLVHPRTSKTCAMSPHPPLRTHSQPREPSHHPARAPQQSPVSNRKSSSPTRSVQAERQSLRPSRSPLLAPDNPQTEKLLRIKDQMIYDLLQERTRLRREKASMEAYLRELSAVSTEEMKKWAKLTDDMQREIEHLRRQLAQTPMAPRHAYNNS